MTDKAEPPGKRPDVPPMPPPKHPNGKGYESEEAKRFKAEMARDIVCSTVRGHAINVNDDFVEQCCFASEMIYNYFFKDPE